MVFFLCETVTFEPLSGLGRARGFLGCSELVGRFFPCSEWFVLRSSSLFLVGALEQMSEVRFYLSVGGASWQIFWCFFLRFLGGSADGVFFM